MRREKRFASVAVSVNCQAGSPKPRQLLADPSRVLGREHRGDAPAELPLHGRDHRGRAMAGHRAGVAEAQVDVVVPIHARCVGAAGRLQEERERTRPLDHPVHGHAVEQARAGAFVQRTSPWVPLGKCRQLALEERVEPPWIDAGGGRACHGRQSDDPVITLRTARSACALELCRVRACAHQA